MIIRMYTCLDRVADKEMRAKGYTDYLYAIDHAGGLIWPEEAMAFIEVQGLLF